MELLLSRENEDFKLLANAMYNEETSMTYIMTKDNFMRLNKTVSESEFNSLEKGSVSVYSDKGYSGKNITIMGKKYEVAGSKQYVADKDLYMAAFLEGTYYIVVDSYETLQEIYNLQKNFEHTKENNYVTEIGADLEGSKQDKMDCANNVAKYLVADDFNNCKNIYLESRQLNEKDFYALYGGFFFLGLILGSMFLMVTVMIIFYKQISEGYDDKERYMIMEKVGMSNEEVKASIKSQIRIVFFLPLLTAVVHVIAAFPMIRRLLVLLNLNNTGLFIVCLIATIAVFTLIYYIVFKLTSKAYYKIVGNQIR